MKKGVDGIEGSRENEVEEPVRLWDYVLCVLAMVMTLAAAIVTCIAKETETIQVQVVSSLPAVPITVSAKSTYSSAFKYFIMVNVIGCSHSAASLFLSAIIGGSNARNLALPLTIADLMMVGLLYSSNGAAAAIGVVGEKATPP